MLDGQGRNLGCWARSLGGCAAKLSREHPFSEAIFPSGVRVEGFPWLKGQVKELGPKALTTKVLCKNHNSGLSPLDISATAAWKGFIEAGELRVFRSRNQKHRWTDRIYWVDGDLFERWCFKVMCGFFATPSYGLFDNWDPPEYLVRYVYGLGQLPRKAGMGALVRLGSFIDNDDRLRFSSIGTSEGVVGAVIGFRGFRFACTWERPVDKLVMYAGQANQESTIYRPVRIQLDHSISIRFRWAAARVTG